MRYKPCGYCRDSGQIAYLNWNRTIRQCPVAQLTGGIKTPSHDSTVCLECNAMAGTSGNLHHASEAAQKKVEAASGRVEVIGS